MSDFICKYIPIYECLEAHTARQPSNQVPPLKAATYAINNLKFHNLLKATQTKDSPAYAHTIAVASEISSKFRVLDSDFEAACKHFRERCAESKHEYKSLDGSAAVATSHDPHAAFFQTNSDTNTQKNRSNSTSNKPHRNQDAPPERCRNYSQGRCRRGNACPYLHEQVSITHHTNPTYTTSQCMIISLRMRRTL